MSNPCRDSGSLRTALRAGCASILCALAAGCGYDAKMRPTMQWFDQGNYSEAANEIAPLLDEYSLRDSNGDGTSDAPINGVIYNLEGGAIQQDAGHYPQSLATFQSVWNEVSPYLDEKPEARVTEEVAAALTNQTIRTYRGTGVDRIMLNTYQALNYYALGRPDKAQVELRRAQKWQEDFVAKHQSRIDSETKAFEEAGRKNGYDAEQTLKDSGFQAQMNFYYGTIREMRGYANYEIPYATYLRGVNRFATGSFEQARVAFKRVAEMLPAPASEAALRDVALASNAAEGKAPPQSVYIFVEAGRGPSLKELRIDIPLFIKEVPYVGAAFPLLEFHDEPSVASFTVEGAGAAAGSALLTDMDAVVAQDFNQRLPGVIIATLVSSASKAAATYALQKNFGDWGAISGAIYQAALNSADLRCWLTLPKRVLWARVDRPESGAISLTLSDGRVIGPIAIPAGPATVIRVRSVAAGSQPAVLVFPIPNPG